MVLAQMPLPELDEELEYEQQSRKLVPRPYQIEAIQWLKKVRRGFLTDYPGLGKTVESSEAAEVPCIVVTRHHLAEQWADHLRAQYPNQKVALAAYGNRYQRERALDVVADWYVITYSMLATYAIPTPIKTFIFDESHHLRNRKASQSRAAAHLVAREDGCRTYFVTASPMWKAPDDIWMQLHIMHPDLFKSYERFVKLFFVSDHAPWGPKVIGVRRTMRKQLDALLVPVTFGRTYEQVGRYLPSTIDQTIYVNLDKERQSVYDALRANYRIQYEDDGEQKFVLLNSSSMLHNLRKITAFPLGGKLDAIKELIDDNGKPTVVFMWYREHAKFMHKMIEKDAVLIDGSIDPHVRRQKCLRAMRQGKHIVATIASVVEGIDLSGYRQVIYGEEDWPPGSNFQSLARIVRDRNDDGTDVEPVLVYHVVTRRTVDVVIHRISRKRQASIKDIIREALL